MQSITIQETVFLIYRRYTSNSSGGASLGCGWLNKTPWARHPVTLPCRLLATSHHIHNTRSKLGPTPGCTPRARLRGGGGPVVPSEVEGVSGLCNAIVCYLRLNPKVAKTYGITKLDRNTSVGSMLMQ